MAHFTLKPFVRYPVRRRCGTQIAVFDVATFAQVLHELEAQFRCLPHVRDQWHGDLSGRGLSLLGCGCGKQNGQAVTRKHRNCVA